MSDVRDLIKGRKLEWEPATSPLCHDHWAALAFNGSYQICPDEDSAAGSWIMQWTIRDEDFCMEQGGKITRHPGPEAAQAAAQADYEARILAAIEFAEQNRTGT